MPNKNNTNNDIIIGEEDKKNIRLKILDAVIYVIEIENIKILKQFNQCVKKILKYDFREKKIQYNKDFIDKVLTCLNSNNLKKIYEQKNIYRQLAKRYYTIQCL